jgi:hypothetical protein
MHTPRQVKSIWITAWLGSGASPRPTLLSLSRLSRMQFLPHMRLVRLHVRPRMAQATVAPTQLPLHADASTNAVVRLVSSDAHLVPADVYAGGDNPHPLRLPRTWGPLLWQNLLNNMAHMYLLSS